MTQQKQVDLNDVASFDADPAVELTNDTGVASARAAVPETVVSPPQKRRMLNVPFLVVTLVLLALLAPAAHFWHGSQVKRTATSLLERADVAEKEEDWTTAAEYVQRYLRLVPGDVKAQVRLAKTYDKSATDFGRKQRAIDVYYQTLGVTQEVIEPDEIAAMRGRLVELLLELRRFAPAEDEAEKLRDETASSLTTNPGNSQAATLHASAARALALARYGLFRNGARIMESSSDDAPGVVGVGAEDKAIGPTFVQALQLNPGDIQLAQQMAYVCRREPQIALYGEVKSEPATSDPPGSSEAEHAQDPLSPPLPPLDKAARAALADQTIDRMVAENTDNPRAYMERYLYRAELAQHEQDAAVRTAMEATAAQDLAKALELGSHDVEVCLAAAGNALQKAGRAATDETERNKLREEAKTFYQRAIESTPADPRPYRMLGQLLITERQQQQAIEILQQGLTNADALHLDLNILLVDALLAKGQLDEKDEASAEASLKVIQEFQQRTGSRLNRPVQLDLQHQTDLLLGRWHVRKGEYEKAIPFLSRVATLGERIAPAEQMRRFQATYLLGQCNLQLGRREVAAEMFEDAALLRPDLVIVHLSAAEAWNRCGQPAAAARHFEQAVKLETTGQAANWADIWFKLAESLYQEQLRILPRENRVWGSFETALAEAVKPGRTPPLSEPWRAGLLEVGYHLVRDVQDADRQKSLERVRTVLAKLEIEHPHSHVMWRQLAVVYQQLADHAAADRACERFSTLQPTGAHRFVQRSQLLATRGDFEAAREVIRQGLAAVPDAETSPLRFALVAISLQEGNQAQAAAELAQLQQSMPGNVQILQKLADMAFERSDLQLSERLKAVEQWETKLKEAEESSKGSLGLLWRYTRARRLLALAKNTQDPNFLEAVRLGTELRTLRPGWPQSVLLSAMTLHRLKRVPEAIDAYKEAIRLGEQRLSVYETLISLLYQTNRLSEAQDYLTQLHEYVPAVENLSGLEILTAVGRGQTEQAIESARAGVAHRPNDPIAHMVLGQMLVVAKKYAEGEAALRRAVELAPTDVRMYDALFVLYTRTNRLDDARRSLAELAAKNGELANPKQPAGTKEFFLARSYEKLGDQAEADAYYRQARQLDPRNIELLSSMATFWATSNRVEAQSLLREAMAIAPEDARLRRGLAVLLATGDEEQWAEAQRLLAEVGDDPAAVLDHRIRAILLVRRGGRAHLQQAQQILEDLIGEGGTGAPSDRLLLARICEAHAAQLQSDARKLAIAGKSTDADALRAEADAQYTSARAHYEALAEPSNSQQKNDYVGALIEFLLRQKAYDDAEQRVAQLSKLSPNNLAVIRLQARLLKATGRTTELQAILEPFATRQLTALQGNAQAKYSPDTLPQAEGQLALAIGGIYAATEQYAAAEPWLRRAMENIPAAYGPLATCLAAQDRVGEGVQLCLEASKYDSSTKPILTLASLLVLGVTAHEDLQIVEPILMSALETHPEDAQLLSAVADVRLVQGRSDEAISLYERALEAEPENLLALNNLATILGEQPNGQEKALGYIDRAIEKSGPAPALLDTKGMILFQAGRFDQARTFLDAATWDPAADPRFFFHLAAACHRLGETEKARQAFEHARANQLERQILTPSDQELLAGLNEAFAG
ncbi:MAG: tetratricopeptide repeat protein [Pirellulaceae bacterium]